MKKCNFVFFNKTIPGLFIIFALFFNSTFIIGQEVTFYFKLNLDQAYSCSDIFKLSGKDIRLNGIPIYIASSLYSKDNKVSDVVYSDENGEAKLTTSLNYAEHIEIIVNGGGGLRFTNVDTWNNLIYERDIFGRLKNQDGYGPYKLLGQITNVVKRNKDVLINKAYIGCEGGFQYYDQLYETIRSNKFLIKINCPIIIAKELRELFNEICTLLNENYINTPANEMINDFMTVINRNKEILIMIPQYNIKEKFINELERLKSKYAEDRFRNKEYHIACSKYEELVTNFPNSHNLGFLKSKRDSCVLIIQREMWCDSIMNKSNEITDKSEKLSFLISQREKVDINNGCWDRINTKINELNELIANEEKEAEQKHQLNEKKKIFQKYHVDEKISQADMFVNPFAFVGKCMIVNCVVSKFDSPNTAVMKGVDYFYADFKVQPPKKLKMLTLIVKVKGIKEVVNAYGTRVKIPLVDVLYILEEQR